MREVEIPGVVSAVEQETEQKEPQVLLILVGLPGSGKTTFAEALIQDHGIANSRKRKWVRASQDDAPSRRRQECEAMTRNALREGHNVIVDRVGFDAVQRSHFINIADQHQPRPRVYALYLSVSVSALEERLSLRKIHPTLADPNLAMMVLRDMTRQLRVPVPEGGEGFDKIYTLDETMQPQGGIWTTKDLELVLGLIETDGEVETGPRQIIHNRPAFNGRGRGYASGRGVNGGRGGRGDDHGYRGGRGGYGRGDAPNQGDGRSWIKDREHRPYPQAGFQAHQGYQINQPIHRPHNSFDSRPSSNIPPPTSHYAGPSQQDNRPL